ncbi:hypothetical protein JZU48_05175, partial [bacterium]|nr:hypothetical protein [bacterium]
VGLASVGPALAWWAYVKSTTGGFFSPETTDFRQFIWVIDGLQQGNLISLAVKNTGWFLVSFADAQTFLALFLVTATLGIITAGVLLQPPAGLPPTSANPSLSRSIRAVGILLPLQIAFIWLMGFYQTRLSWGILTTLIVGLAIERLAGSAWVLRINVIAIVVAAGWYATWLAIPGPWH